MVKTSGKEDDNYWKNDEHDWTKDESDWDNDEKGWNITQWNNDSKQCATKGSR